jgi:hypothetical protein
VQYWEIIADKLSRCRLVMGLLQRRYPRWLALDLWRYYAIVITAEGKDLNELTFFFATTVSEPPQLARNLACAVARHENSVALWLNQST